MAYADFTQLANILEKDIMPTVESQVYKKSILWQIFGGFSAEEKVATQVNPPQVSFANNTIYVTTQNGRPAVGAISIKNKFNYGVTPTNQGSLGIAIETGAFMIPKAVLNMKDSGTIVNALQFNVKSTTDSMAMDLNRQAYGDGTATLAYVATAGSTVTTVTLAPKPSVSTTYNGDIPLAVRYFAVGMPIKIGSNAATTVTAITGDNEITIADAQTITQYSAIVKLDGSGTVAAEMVGLSAMVNNTGTYMGIDSSTDSTWKSTVIAGSPSPFDIAKLESVYLSAGAIGNPNFVVMNKTNFLKYAGGLTSQIQAAGTDTLYGGWKSVGFMGGNAKVILDYDCPDDKIYVLSSEDLFRAELQPFEFEPGTLGNGQRITQQLDYEVVASWMGNIGTTRRGAHAVLSNQVT